MGRLYEASFVRPLLLANFRAAYPLTVNAGSVALITYAITERRPSPGGSLNS